MQAVPAPPSPALLCDLRLEPATGVCVEAKFTLERGTLIVFGPSGAGKTVTLRALAGLLKPTSGQLAIGGEVVVKIGGRNAPWGTDRGREIFVTPQARGVGYAPQHPALFPHLVVRENILAGRSADPLEVEARQTANPLTDPFVQELIDALALAPLLERRPGALSGGQKQRVSLARALARRPRLLLLDEPLSAIDLAERRRIEDWLRRRLRELQLPTVLVTHDPLEALGMGDHLALLQAGRTVGEGAPAAMLGQHGLVSPEVLPPFLEASARAPSPEEIL